MDGESQGEEEAREQLKKPQARGRPMLQDSDSNEFGDPENNEGDQSEIDVQATEGKIPASVSFSISLTINMQNYFTIIQVPHRSSWTAALPASDPAKAPLRTTAVAMRRNLAMSTVLRRRG